MYQSHVSDRSALGAVLANCLTWAVSLRAGLQVTDKEDVAGLPESALALGAQSAAKEGHEGATPEAGPWVFTLDMPSYQPVLTHAKNRCESVLWASLS